MGTFVLSPEADADVADIFDYTAREWGVDQAYKYLMQLNACAEHVAGGNGQPRDHSEIRPGLRSIRCQKHVIFFVRMEDMSVWVVGVFHEKMNLMARIAARVG